MIGTEVMTWTAYMSRHMDERGTDDTSVGLCPSFCQCIITTYLSMTIISCYIRYVIKETRLYVNGWIFYSLMLSRNIYGTLHSSQCCQKAHLTTLYICKWNEISNRLNTMIRDVYEIWLYSSSFEDPHSSYIVKLSIIINHSTISCRTTIMPFNSIRPGEAHIQSTFI